ncbi:DNA internalization-related competence protein ComEC/Rec2 [Limnohabitans sp. T6-5]|uniref:DNA internalization-related competence protein ComEC/Rec2 n=1 Tax=Limnohabitans sp. T6-5 TaxID=1100724 RepID=UPI000D3878E0|nr:DNA internalization-related competence protein ComEC/Rec2 [Limnohabitans sp. T6-5]PUE07312.1 DNA internalization-related competence protein ComEC/Rec2 [Limnohabitans sp. T6-5]
MNWAQRLWPCLLAWCVGLALQLQQAALWPTGAYLGMAALAALWVWGLSRAGHGRWLAEGTRLGLMVLAWGGLSFACTGLHAVSKVVSTNSDWEGHDLDLVGVVQAMPQRQEQGWRFRFQVEDARRAGVAVVVPEQLYLGWYGKEGVSDSGWRLSPLPEPVLAGERWRLRARLKAPHGHLNPRGFDYELWLWEQGVGATAYVRTGATDPPPQRLAQTWTHPVEWWRQSVRDRLLLRLSAWGEGAWGGGAAPGPNLAGIVAALVTGDQAAIDRSDWDVFRATGVAHLMSISGLHVTMFAWLAAVTVGWCWRMSALWGFQGALRWPAAHVGAWAGLVLAALYALFSGWGVPAQRTLWMLAVVVVLRVSARQWPVGLIWLLAGVVVLTIDPWALLQAGFWLSFVAVGVLLASTGHDGHAPPEVPGQDAWDAPKGGTKGVPFWVMHQGGAGLVKQLRTWVCGPALTRVLGLLREQGVVTVALAPLTLLFFGQLSLVGLLANLVAIPWVTLLITPLAMLGLVWPGAWVWAAVCLQPLVVWLSWLATWPQASVSTAMPPWGLAVLALVGAVVWVLPAPRSLKVLSVPLFWPVLFWASPRPVVGSFELLAADVGQGNAVLVRTAHHSLLYDAGPQYSTESDAGHRVLVPLLSQMGERLDRLVLSHRDSDHTGGARAILAMQPQADLWTSLEDEHPLHRLRGTWTRCQAGQSWVWDGVRFEVLHPPSPSMGAKDGRDGPVQDRQSLGKPNAVSCVLRISDAHASALLAGDIESPQELRLVEAGLSKVDVLLVPHHGSKTSSSPPFLQTLQPRLALVQAGYRNRFGHPAAPVVARYDSLHIRVVDSAHCGAATWRSDAPEQVLCERERSRRYWHHLPP